jgi:hypothetical protein
MSGRRFVWAAHVETKNGSQSIGLYSSEQSAIDNVGACLGSDIAGWRRVELDEYAARIGYRFFIQRVMLPPAVQS